MIRIAIADDHQLIREGLKKVVLAHQSIAVVGEAADLESVLAMLAETAVDVLVLDLSLDGRPDIQALHAVREAYPDLAVLVLSVHAEDRFAVPALKAGAAGYVCKAMAVDEVVGAIEKIAKGGRYVSPLVAELLAHEVSRPPSVAPHLRLTRRETDVFQLLGAGVPIKQAAAQLGLSISSVNTYRTRIFRKMGLKSNAALIRYAIEQAMSA